MKENFSDNPTPSTLVTLGLGYLWTAKYQEAAKHFQDWMDRYGVTADAYFSLIGVAQWCLSDYETASSSWKLGLKAQYIDMAGGTRLPLLLWAASILRPNDKLRKEAVGLLDSKVKSPKVRHWPGPIAQFALDQIDASTVVEQSKERLSQKTPPSYRWEIAFYTHLRAKERGVMSSNEFKEVLRELVDTSVSEWSGDENFLQLVRNPEFYIARHEVSAGSASATHVANSTETDQT